MAEESTARAGFDSGLGTESATVVRSVGAEWLVKGVKRAAKRLEAAAQDADRSGLETYLPVFEALNWIASLDQLLGWPELEIMRALRFARNRVHHQWADALEGRSLPAPYIRTSLRSGLAGGALFFDWYWRPSSELPQAEGSRNNDPYGENAYYDLCANRQVRGSLGQALADLAAAGLI